ncbi:hypothetical protein D3C79_863230 [compost metagenome]
MAHGPGEHAEGRAALALAVTAEHQQQAAFVRGVGNTLVDYRLLALHTGQVAFVTLGGFSHRSLRKPLSANLQRAWQHRAAQRSWQRDGNRSMDKADGKTRRAAA